VVTNDAIDLERELKFEAPFAAALPDLRDLVGRTERLPQRIFSSVYFDTADMRLWSRGITLRFRSEQEEPRGTWTLKLPSGIPGPVRERTEVSWEGGRASVPAGVIEVTRGIIRREPLRELVELDTVRQRLALHDESDRVLGEIDDDVVSIVGGPRQGDRFRQVEFELIADKKRVAEKVTERFASAQLSAGASPKLAVALGLQEHDERHDAELDRRSSLREVLKFAIADSLGQLLDHDWRLRLAAPDMTEIDVHKARVATRRLRSNLKAMQALLDPVWAAHVRKDLKWLGSALGDVRDVDVLTGLLEASPAELQARLSRDREAAVQRLVSALTSDRYLKLLDRLHAASQNPPGATGDQIFASDRGRERLTHLVNHEWRTVRRRVQKAGSDPSDRQLHRIRIGAKGLRYTAEMAAPVIGEKGLRVARAAEDLQTVLGEQHDAVAAEHWLQAQVCDRSRESGHEISAPSAFAAGRLAADEQRTRRKVRRRWSRSWKALRREAKAFGG
jgi:CHAD domain-containing protein